MQLVLAKPTGPRRPTRQSLHSQTLVIRVLLNINACRLTQGTFVLISGRLGAVYGHRHVLIGGAVWFVICSLANGFCKTFVAFNVARALSGIGGALIMPNAVALISTTIPPGRSRNVTLGFFGASGPIGSYLGAIWAGVFIEYADWTWIFFGM